MDPLINTMLGQYRIDQLIGQGGMAKVYKAFQPSLNRYVALKVLPPSFAHDEAFVQRFKAEAQSAARLKHPNIVVIHDVGEANGYHFIVMELLQGETLKTLIEKNGALPEPRALKILEQIASALDYAHGMGLVHRDVKPANIIIGPDDHATLTDFGIALALEGSHITRTGTLVGTPAYMSPEQARGERDVDARTDTYSLGVVAYEMFGGRVPFDGATSHAILHKVIYEPPPALRSINPRVSAQVERAIMCALEKDRSRRYAATIDIVRAISHSEFIPPPPPAPKPHLSASQIIAIGFVAGFILIGFVIVLSLLAKSPSAPPLVSASNVAAEAIKSADPYASDANSWVTIQPYQSFPVYMKSTKTVQVLNAYVEMKSATPTKISVFIAPYCRTPIFIGVANVEQDKNGYPVFVPMQAAEKVYVTGEFCVLIQATDPNVAIAHNRAGQPLVTVNVTKE